MIINNQKKTQITFALPSKGRLKEMTLSLLERSGYNVDHSSSRRNYRSRFLNFNEIEIIFLSAAEIARELSRGNIDLGITGEDLINENLFYSRKTITFCKRLGFGYADVVVAVPEFWYDVTTMDDLDDVAANFLNFQGRRLRIATKYCKLTRKFFSQKHGIQVYRIIESMGATEGAPSSGSADVIVDITSTGETLKANKLKVLDDGVILKSQACLFMIRRHNKIKEIYKIYKNIEKALKDY